MSSKHTVLLRRQLSKVEADVALVLPFGDRRLAHGATGLRTHELAADRWDGVEEGDSRSRERHAGLPYQGYGRGLWREDLHVDWGVLSLLDHRGNRAFRGVEL